MPTDYREYLRKRFPYLEKAIDDKLKASEDFVTLCKDYVEAVDILTQWEDAPEISEKTKDLIIDYRRLVENLEAEILFELYRSASSC